MLGVCSWSLQPTDVDDLFAKVSSTGVSGLQLALDPIRTGAWSIDEVRRGCEAHGVTLISGMMATEGEDYSTLETIRVTGGVRPDEHWETNLAAAKEDARIASELGLTLVTFHAGFLPHDRTDPERARLIDRLRTIADVFAERGVRTGFETGQESAATLLDVLVELDHDRVGVNFDPANMILYGMGDPISALRALQPHVVQVHIKDAVATTTPGTWGEEVAAGEGEVAWDAFFDITRRMAIDHVIEREAGDDRIGDVKKAAAVFGT